jgi:hypothetical protein
VALLVLTYLALVSPRRADADSLTEQTAAAEQANDATQLRTAQLRALYATLPQRRAELTTMIAQLPVTADIPGFVRSIDALAHSSGVVLNGITPAAATYLGANGAGAPAAAGANGAATIRPVAIPVTVVVRGPYFKAVTFLQRLQSGQRAFLVNNLQVTVAGAGVTLTVKGDIFALPGAAQALKDASPDAKPAAPAAPAAAPALGAAAAADGSGPMAGPAAEPTTAPATAPQGGTSTSAYPSTPSAPTSPPHLTTAPATAGTPAR